MPTARLPLRIIDREVLRYLGVPEGASAAHADSRMARLLADARAWAELHVQPLASYATFEAAPSPGGVAVAGAFAVRSGSLARLLCQAERVTIMAVTAGAALDLETSALSAAGRMAEAAALDALGSDAVEQAANDLCDRLAGDAAATGYRLTRRFSPGYGDLGLDLQPALIDASGAAAIGITVSSSMMLRPMKSITAILGWVPETSAPATHDLPAACDSCGSCSCRYRRPGPKE